MMKIRTWRIPGQNRTFYEIEEICEDCCGTGELYYDDIHKMLVEMWKYYDMHFRELRQCIKEYKQKGYITCPSCGGKGYIIYNM